jgi:hypothetical protein
VCHAQQIISNYVLYAKMAHIYKNRQESVKNAIINAKYVMIQQVVVKFNQV